MNKFLSRAIAWCIPVVVATSACAQDSPAKIVPERVEPQRVAPMSHPYLWRIEGDPVQWLFGTIHLPDKRVTTLPESVDAAIDACDVLLTELVIDAATQATLAKETRLPKGKTLSDVLPPATYQRLDEYCKSKSFPLAAVATQKPWVLVAMLPMLDDLKAIMGGRALDLVLVDEAKARDKETGALETPMEQVGAFEGLSAAEMIELIDATLDVLEKAAAEKRSLFQELVELYVKGDLQALHDAMDSLSGLSGHEELEAKFEKLLLTDRNHRMVDRMLARMKAAPKASHFFAVGALHYPGKDGILALLEAKGCRVTRVGGDPPKATGEKTPAGASPKEAIKVPATTGRGR